MPVIKLTRMNYQHAEQYSIGEPILVDTTGIVVIPKKYRIAHIVSNTEIVGSHIRLAMSENSREYYIKESVDEIYELIQQAK